MRPLRLAMEGLTAFPDRQEIDLSKLGLFCVTGATGAGKTTMFDAIAFALYGRAPRVGREVRRLVASARGEARVELEFRSGESTFRVARRLKLTASGNTSQKALLERLDGTAWTTFVDGPDAVARSVEEITGLGFEAFTRAVMLPQGDFARLLNGPAKDRRSILVQLLDLGRVEDAARRARGEGTALRGQERVLTESMNDELADVTFDAIRAAKQAFDHAAARHGALREAAHRARDREDAARQSAERGQRILGIAEALDEMSRRDEAARAEALDLAPRAAEARQRIAIARDGRSAAERRHAEATARVSDVVAARGDERRHATLRAALRERGDAVAEIEAARHDAEEVADAVARADAEHKACLADLVHAEQRALEQSRAALQAAEAAAGQAAVALANARESHEEALDALARLERHELGASIREMLEEGDPCPVCERPVDETLPPVPHDLADHIANARAAVEEAHRLATTAEATDRASHAKAEAAKEVVRGIEGQLRSTPPADHPPRNISLTVDETRRAVEAAEAALSQARERAAAVAGRRAAAEQRVRDSEERLSDAFGRPLPSDVEQRLTVHEQALVNARRALADADTAREKARAHLDAEITAHEGITAHAARLDAEAVSRAQEAKRLAGDLTTLTDGVLAVDGRDPTTLAAMARGLAVGITRQADADLAAVAVLATAQGITAAADASVRETLETAAHHAHADMVRRDTEVATLMDRMRQKEARATRLAGLAREAELMESLSRHLDGNHFIEFLLAESVETLCVRASERLGEMSGGRYSMEMNEGTVGSLVVVDHHNADERRGVDTLSGGETFQGALALALALSESVADLGGPSRLDAVFVDEGFASLDAESLDLAIDALETVQAGGRMVGVITHMPQMAERIPDGLDVVKGPGGSTVVPRAA